MTSWSHVRGQPVGLCFQVCLKRLDLSLNARRHISQKLVMSRIQNPHQRGNLNLPIIKPRCFFISHSMWYFTFCFKIRHYLHMIYSKMFGIPNQNILLETWTPTCFLALVIGSANICLNIDDNILSQQSHTRL